MNLRRAGYALAPAAPGFAGKEIAARTFIRDFAEDEKFKVFMFAINLHYRYRMQAQRLANTRLSGR
jgi:hypothetical protein